jgi:hypothetical protein
MRCRAKGWALPGERERNAGGPNFSFFVFYVVKSHKCMNKRTISLVAKNVKKIYNRDRGYVPGILT